MNYREKRKKEKIRAFMISLICISMCIIVSPLIFLYMLTPKDEILKSTKEYYLTSSIDYFLNNEEKSKVTIDYLIKSGYAKELSNLKNSSCDRNTSYIIKHGDIYNISLLCYKYNSELAIYVNKDGK